MTHCFDRCSRCGVFLLDDGTEDATMCLDCADLSGRQADPQ